MKIQLSLEQKSELLNKRFELIEMINSSRSSVNEVSLNSVKTISLSDLKNNIDFEKYPELKFLFTNENLAYLRPYKGNLQGLEDNELGIVSKGLVATEIALLTGIDLSGRNSASPVSYYTESIFDMVKTNLTKMGCQIKSIDKFSDLLDIKSFYANNVEAYNSKGEYKYPTDNIFYNDKNNTLVYGSFSENIYDLIYTFGILDTLNLDDKIKEDSNVEIEPFEFMTLNEAILNILEIIPTHVEDGKLFLSEYPYCFIEYDGGPVQCEIADFIEGKYNNLLQGNSQENDLNIEFLDTLIYEISSNLYNYDIDKKSEIVSVLDDFKSESYWIDEY